MTTTAGSVSAPQLLGHSRVDGRTAATPLWRRLSITVLLLGTTVVNLWDLSVNGWANSFYAAAIEAGSKSWKAWFFGSSDMANSITVDKPPASLWLPGISVRIFGLNSWSMLIPNALLGVASVALLYWITRKYLGHWSGILAGTVLALTPVAAMMFRFNNPEALLLLLMIAAVGACLKAVEDGRIRWMLLVGVFLGFGFLTKQLQVMLIVPAVMLTYFGFGPHGWLTRLGHCFAALGAFIVSAGWWLLIVELWPVSSRPWIGGSQHNSILELTLGYNGFGRLNGNETGSVMAGGPGGNGGGGMWGQTGFLRMFEPEQGGQIAWLIPSALLLGVAAAVIIGRAKRTDIRRAYLAVWGLWLLVTMVVFSYMAGIFHSYYTAALAPAVAALLAGGAAIAWRARANVWVRLVLAAAVWIAAIWGFLLLARSENFMPWLRYVVLMLGIVGGAVMLLAHRTYVAATAVIVSVTASLAGPFAYTVDTITTPKQSSIISAGPAVGGGFGPGGGPGGPGGRGPGGGPQAGGGQQGGGQQGGGPGGGGPGGGLLMGSRPGSELVSALRVDADDFTWIAATVGSNTASGYQLATGYSVMPIGGFNGTDPYPTLEEFRKLVREKKIHYFIGGGDLTGAGPDGAGPAGSGSGAGSTSAQIAQWVQANFAAQTIDSIPVYDLT
ncbi:MAG: glycosyltransferase family 39 protein, partial [Gordonia sp. (in: high G+C Gram-positive bacteria)]